MKKYAFIFTAFLIAVALIGCGNPAGGNEDTRGIGAFEPGIWFYDIDLGAQEKYAIEHSTNGTKNWVQYFVFAEDGTTLLMYGNTNYYSAKGGSVLEKQNSEQMKYLSNFEECKNTLLSFDKRNVIPFYKVRTDGLALYSPFKNTWWSRSFEVNDSDGKRNITEYCFFKNYTIEKYIKKDGDKSAKSGDIAEIEKALKKSVTEMFYNWFIDDLYKSDNTRIPYKICNESDVPAVTP